MIPVEAGPSAQRVSVVGLRGSRSAIFSFTWQQILSYVPGRRSLFVSAYQGLITGALHYFFGSGLSLYKSKHTKLAVTLI